MIKIPLLFLIIVYSSCVRQEKAEIDSSITKLELINKAEYYYGGIEFTTISNKDEIEDIKREISKLKNDLSSEILISVNYGYVEIILTDIKGDRNEYFSVVFTKHNGEIIRYGGKHYYRSPDLVNLIKETLRMQSNNKLSND